jgi:hypothetical protein
MPARTARLWIAALVAAAIPWIYKLLSDRGAPVVSTHETVVGTKLMALVLLAAYAFIYLGITAAFGIPEAKHLVDRGARALRIGRRSR